MIELIGKSDDDPPIFALRVTGYRAADQLRAWLSDSATVRRIEVRLDAGADLSSDDVARLSRQHAVRIEVAEGGAGESASTVST
jgi:hypothetical protein